MKITVLANPTQDGRVLYKAEWVHNHKNEVSFVCVKPETFFNRMEEKGWKYV